jgi:hypothetical protein
MSLIHADTEFVQSRLPEHYTPPREPTTVVRFVRGAICLTCFACIGALLAACGGGDEERSSNNLPQCAAQPEACK